MGLVKINFKKIELCCNSLSEKDKILAIGDSTGIVRILDIRKNFNSGINLKSHKLEISKIINDESNLISCSSDTKIKRYDLRKQIILDSFIGHNGPVNDLDIFQKSMISASEDGDVRLWDLRENKFTGKLTHGFNLSGCKFMNNSNLIVSVGLDNTLFLWDLRMNKTFLKKTEVLRNENNIVISLCVSKFSNYLFILNNNFRVFRIGKKYTHCSEFIGKKKERNPCFYRMKLNEDDNSKFLLHGNLEGKIFIRNQKSGKILKQFYDHLSEVTEITLNQKIKTLVSCGKDGSVVIRKVNFLD